MFKFSIAGLIMAAAHIAILVYTLAQIMTAGAGDWTVYWRIFLRWISPSAWRWFR